MVPLKPLTKAHIQRLLSSNNPRQLLQEFHLKGFWIEDFLIEVLNGEIPCPEGLTFEDVTFGKEALKAFSLSNVTLFFKKTGDGSYAPWP
ncbi:hypothetical protein D6764_01635 [Candidatus Woesearchaeota archaeon]|nr:MAG: hypothetical protein D6764_01635 [Candidatus Woesearchaeota archaeon]